MLIYLNILGLFVRLLTDNQLVLGLKVARLFKDSWIRILVTSG